MYVRGPIITASEATAAQRTFTFEAVDATDGFTPETAHTYAGAEVQVSKNGGAFATAAGVATQISTTGVFQFVAAVADVDTIGEALFRFADASSRTVLVACQIAAFDLNAALTSQTIADAFTETRTRTRRYVMEAGTIGDTIFDGSDTGRGVDVLQALRTVITVAGTFDSTSAQVQTCADPTAAVPAWINSGSALTSAGSVTVTGPVGAVRVVTSGGGGSAALTCTALIVEPRI
jgi:hypothetical protein